MTIHKRKISHRLSLTVMFIVSWLHGFIIMSLPVKQCDNETMEQ